jgi:signal transduction histidine kinase
MKYKNTEISSRIKKALLSLSFGLSLVFGLLTFLLLYVIEDQVFTNLLMAEQAHFNQLSPSESVNWQPSNRYMKFVDNKKQLPKKFQSIVSDKFGVYEFFENGQAYFILHSQKEIMGIDLAKSYYIIFDVTELLAVRDGKFSLISAIVFVTLCVMLLAMFISIRLSRKILAPLKTLTSELQNNGFTEMNKGFSLPFAGDEVGVLATQLEKAIEQAQSAVQREFEFNSGVSHELRTPIQVAMNSVELLEFTQVDLKDNKAMNRLKRAIAQMEQISEAFLWLASQRSIEKKLTNPFPVLENLKSHYENLYPNHTLNVKPEENISLKYCVPQSVFTVIIDNLLRNAFQHGAVGEVKINLSRDAVQILNLKLETSQSIEDSKIKHPEAKGYGIGLMIVKRICQRLNWQINLQDKDETYFETKIKFDNNSVE